MNRLSRRKDQAQDPRTEVDQVAWLEAQGWRLWWRRDKGLTILHDQTGLSRTFHRRHAKDMVRDAYESVCERPAGQP